MILLTILLVIVVIAFVPFLGFFIGWGLGWILNLIMGCWIIDGLALFGISVSPELVPLFFAIVGTIASVFCLCGIGRAAIDKEKD